MSGQKPLVIRHNHGTVIDVVTTDEKGFKKSVEQGRLWVLHPETGRLLPYDDDRYPSSIMERTGWYEAVLVDATATSDGPIENHTPIGMSDVEESSHAAAGVGVDVLKELYTLIERRKRDLPEGSYTTYLFTEGVEKIKKKTGEEAIELLLAGNHSERIHEAADLIYHLFVLLVETDVRLEELLAELDSR